MIVVGSGGVPLLQVNSGGPMQSHHSSKLPVPAMRLTVASTGTAHSAKNSKILIKKETAFIIYFNILFIYYSIILII